MLIALTGIALLQVFLSYVKFHKIFNPVSAILTWYFILIWISRLGILDLYIPSVDSSSLIMANVVVLSFVVLFATKGGVPQISIEARENGKQSDLLLLERSSWLHQLRKICEILCLVTVVAVDLNIVVKLLTGAMTASQIRYALIFQEASSSFNPNFLYFNLFVRDFLTYFVRFFVLFDLLIEICNLGMYNKQLKLFPLLNFGLFCIAMMTRIDILKAALLFVIVLLFVKEKGKRKKLSRKNKRIILVAFLFALVVIIMRVYEGDNIIDFTVKNAFGSLIGPFEAFSIYFERYKVEGPLVDFATIRIFFGGITAIVEAFLINIARLDMSGVVKTVNSTLDEIVFVGPGQTFNAFYTMYYDFLASGGILGTFLGSIICGIFLSYSYNRFKGHPCVSSCLLFVLWEYIIIFGVIQWRGGLTEWVCIVCVWLGNKIVLSKSKYKEVVTDV